MPFTLVVLVLFLGLVYGERSCLLSGKHSLNVRTRPECAILCGMQSECLSFSVCENNEQNYCVTYEKRLDNACVNISLMVYCENFVKMERSVDRISLLSSTSSTSSTTTSSISSSPAANEATTTSSCGMPSELCQGD
ncbi:uncharacterized protein LOC134234707 [Saccostrea cucullata]|uniref:uncharacterized protein LOC134234707 n=1 Tax=Saccostrea cuccullata TaxID=36930 RepID=UPI002ED2EECF